MARVVAFACAVATSLAVEPLLVNGSDALYSWSAEELSELRRPVPPPSQPGLILTMLIKNEREHLSRTLPSWSRLIDAYVIGVDDANSDDSVAVIRRTLAHVPGVIAIVHFDGMGPTWSRLVAAGYRHFPHVSHGILADADFAPLPPYRMDKGELNASCSKLIFSMLDETHAVTRKLDWIYRNIPGARVERRTHQSVQVPPVAGDGFVRVGEVLSLVLDERTGGYQDRTGGARGKALRYIGFLEADLAEFGSEDTRSLYYLGIGHLDAFTIALAEARNDLAAVSREDWEHLNASLNYFNRRARIPAVSAGTLEERFFAVIKAGEIQERYYRDATRALAHYIHVIRLDTERADGWFYAGQVLALQGAYRAAIPFLRVAAVLPMPDRAMFNWRTLYVCTSKFELGRTMALMMPSPTQWSNSSAPPAELSLADLQYKDETAWILEAYAPLSLAQRLWQFPRKLSLHDIDAARQALTAARSGCGSDASAEAASILARIDTVDAELAVLRRKVAQLFPLATAAPAAAQTVLPVRMPEAPVLETPQPLQGMRYTSSVRLPAACRAAAGASTAADDDSSAWQVLQPLIRDAAGDSIRCSDVRGALREVNLPAVVRLAKDACDRTDVRATCTRQLMTVCAA